MNEQRRDGEIPMSIAVFSQIRPVECATIDLLKRYQRREKAFIRRDMLQR
jgi:hypothetical protein